MNLWSAGCWGNVRACRVNPGGCWPWWAEGTARRLLWLAIPRTALLLPMWSRRQVSPAHLNQSLLNHAQRQPFPFTQVQWAFRWHWALGRCEHPPQSRVGTAACPLSSRQRLLAWEGATPSPPTSMATHHTHAGTRRLPVMWHPEGFALRGPQPPLLPLISGTAPLCRGRGARAYRSNPEQFRQPCSTECPLPRNQRPGAAGNS